MNVLLNLVPWWGRALMLVALSAALIGFGYVKGAEHGQHRIDAMVGKAATEGVRIAKGRDTVTTRIETQFIPQIAKAQVITETIVKEVPVYVYATDPDLPGRYRVLHDAAATGSVPDPSSIPDAASVPAQDLASTVVENYGSCRQAIIELTGLQQWVREQQQVK